MNSIDEWNDKVIIAIDNGREIRTEVFDFHGYKPGSNIRYSRVCEYERYIEALKGQGCKIGCWSPEYWWRVKDGVLAGKIKLN